eukprot:6203694-Heterocapsa_arctica.AAC.1
MPSAIVIGVAALSKVNAEIFDKEVEMRQSLLVLLQSSVSNLSSDTLLDVTSEDAANFVSLISNSHPIASPLDAFAAFCGTMKKRIVEVTTIQLHKHVGSLGVLVKAMEAETPWLGNEPGDSSLLSPACIALDLCVADEALPWSASMLEVFYELFATEGADEPTVTVAGEGSEAVRLIFALLAMR